MRVSRMVRKIFFLTVLCSFPITCPARTLSKLTTFFFKSYAERSEDMRRQLYSPEAWYPLGSAFSRLYSLVLGFAIERPLAALTFSDTSLTDFGHSAISHDIEAGDLSASAASLRHEWRLQKIVVEADARVIIIGDLRGNLHAFLRILWTLALKRILTNNFEITDQKIYLVFCGNYSNHGLYGLEVWYFLLRLKKHNMKNVIILRGASEWGYGDDGRRDVDDGFVRFEDESDKALYHGDGTTPLSAFIGRKYRNFPVGLLCCSKESADKEGSCLFISGGGVPAGDGFSYDPSLFLRDHRTSFASVTEEQARATVNPHYLADAAHVRLVQQWLQQSTGASGRPLICGVVVGGGYYTRMPFRRFPRASMLPSLTSHRDPDESNSVSFNDPSLFPVVQVSSVVDLPDNTTYEGTVVWFPDHQSVRTKLGQVWPIRSGYPSLSLSSIRDFAFFCRWTPQPDDGDANPISILLRQRLTQSRW